LPGNFFVFRLLRLSTNCLLGNFFWQIFLKTPCNLVILDKDNKVISCPGGATPLYENGTLKALMKEGDLVNNRHDVCVDTNENLYLCQWHSGTAPPYKLHRLPS